MKRLSLLIPIAALVLVLFAVGCGDGLTGQAGGETSDSASFAGETEGVFKSATGSIDDEVAPLSEETGSDLARFLSHPDPKSCPGCNLAGADLSNRSLNSANLRGANLAGAGSATTEVLSRWRDTLARAGKETELGGDLILNFSIHLADTEKQAMDEVRSAFEENMKMFAPLGFVRGLSDEQMSALGDPARARAAGLPSIEGAVEAGNWLCGLRHEKKFLCWFFYAPLLLQLLLLWCSVQV